jgi:hypothetical protein
MVNDDVFVSFAASNCNSLVDFQALFDSGSSDHIAPASLLPLCYNVRDLDPPKVFNGIGGSIRCSYLADCGPLHDIYLGDEVPRALISLHQLHLAGFTVSLGPDKITATSSEAVLTFTRSNKLFVLSNIASDLCSFPAVEATYTKAERERARAARDAHDSLDHPGKSTMQKWITNGTLRHLAISHADVELAEKLFGPCVSCSQAKASAPPQVSAISSDFSTSKIGHTQYVDAFYIRLADGSLRIKFIFVDAASGKVIVVHATYKNKSEFKRAVSLVSGFYKQRDFSSVRLIFSDNEPAVHAFEIEFAAEGGRIVFVAAGEHIHPAEAAIKDIKNMMRAVLLGLPYEFPYELINYLLDDCVKLKSLRPTRQTGVLSVLEVTDGVKPDFSRLRFPFGCVGITTIPTERRGSALDPRAELAILLGRNLYGPINFTVILLRSWHIVNRRHFQPVPITEEIIALIKRHRGISDPRAFLPETIRGGNPDDDVDVDRASWELIQRGFAEDSASVPSPPSRVKPPSASVPSSDIVPPVAVAPIAKVAPIIDDDAVPDLIDDDDDSSIGKVPHTPVVKSAAASASVKAPSPVKSPPKSKKPRVKSAISSKIDEIKALVESSNNAGQSMVASDLMAEAYPKMANKVGSNMNFKKAIREYDNLAQGAGYNEIKQMVDKDIFYPTRRRDLPPSKRNEVIRSFTFFKAKLKQTGELEKIKARLVAGGNLVAVEGLGDIASPTVKLESVMLLHAIAAQFGLQLTIMDVPGAYLNTRLPEEQQIPMILGAEEVIVLLQIKPEWREYVRDDGTMIVMLRGGLYGLPQSAKLWFNEVSGRIKDFGYTALQSDPCVFVKFDKTGRRSIVALYVDDFAHWFEKEGFDRDLISMLESHYGKLTISKGDAGIYVGVEFDYNRRDKSVKLTMNKYLNKFFKDFSVDRGSRTPTSHDFMVVDESSPRIDSKRFASCVMTLYYLALRVRKDILFPITVLATRIVDAREHDLKKFTKLARYLFATQDYAVVLRPRGTKLVFIIDAAYLVHPSNSRSHTGFVLTMGRDETDYGGPIFCRSTVQKLIANSSFEAEANGVHQNISYVSPLRLFMSEIGIDQGEASLLGQDNKAAIHTYVNGPSASMKAAHVRMRINNVKEYIEGGELAVKYIKSEDMIADALTKCHSSIADGKALQRLLNI